MRRSQLFSMAVIAVCVTMAGSVFAKDGDGPKSRPERSKASRPGGPPSAEQIFKRIDTDGDGKITQEEFKIAHEKLMERMRSRGPGQAHGQRPSPRGPSARGGHPHHRGPDAHRGHAKHRGDRGRSCPGAKCPSGSDRERHGHHRGHSSHGKDGRKSHGKDGHKSHGKDGHKSHCKDGHKKPDGKCKKEKGGEKST